MKEDGLLFSLLCCFGKWTLTWNPYIYMFYKVYPILSIRRSQVWEPKTPSRLELLITLLCLSTSFTLLSATSTPFLSRRKRKWRENGLCRAEFKKNLLVFSFLVFPINEICFSWSHSLNKEYNVLTYFVMFMCPHFSYIVGLIQGIT